MAALPYIQLYVADYLADTMHLTTEEHGAYLLLIFNYWQTGKPIPKHRLHRIARVSAERWPDIQAILSEFFEDDGENWIHLRVERDIETVLSAPRSKKSVSSEGDTGYKGYIYFVDDPATERVKIGYSKNPWARLSELRSRYGKQLSVVATIKTVDRGEESVHAALAEFHSEGEWFSNNECIKSLISATSSGVVTTVANLRSYVDDYCRPTTATTNKDKDIRDINPLSPPLLEKSPSKPPDTPDKPVPKRKSRLPNPFRVTGDMRHWASDRAAAVNMTLETEKFVNYWRGSGGTKLDWEATWRTWMLKAQEDASRRLTGPPRGPSTTPDFNDTTWAEEPIL